MEKERAEPLRLELESAPESAPEGVRVAVNRCPFCHDDVGSDDRRALVCRVCLSRHHGACWSEGRRCASCGATDPLAVQGRWTPRLLPSAAQAGAPLRSVGRRVLRGVLVAVVTLLTLVGFICVALVIAILAAF